MKYYDTSVLYHPGRANVVADSLSGLTMASVSHIDEAKKDLVQDVYRISTLGVSLEDSSNARFMVRINYE